MLRNRKNVVYFRRYSEKSEIWRFDYLKNFEKIIGAFTLPLLNPYKMFDMLSYDILCQRNSVETEQLYSNKYPERKQLRRFIFSRSIHNSKKYGAFKKNISTKTACWIKRIPSFAVSLQNPESSSREIIDQTGVLKSIKLF